MTSRRTASAQHSSSVIVTSTGTAVARRGTRLPAVSVGRPRRARVRLSVRVVVAVELAEIAIRVMLMVDCASQDPPAKRCSRPYSRSDMYQRISGRVRSAVRPSRVRLARRKFTKAAGEEASAMCGTEAAHVNLGDWGRWTWGPALSRPRELQELQWRQGRLILFTHPPSL